MPRYSLIALALLLSLSACTNSVTSGEVARVTRVIDGDTIEVTLNGQTERVRYIGINTPERDEPCYQAATDANRALVAGQTVRFERDATNRDRFGRLLRYVYAGDTFVNLQLITEGYAEATLYEPDDAYYDQFLELERQATRAGRGCHPTGIFDDGTFTR